MIFLFVVTMGFAQLPSIFADVTIQINGNGTPGCEESNSCFTPFNAKISVGESVTWDNSSPSYHLLTSGKSSDGPDGYFESNLNSGESVTFEFSSSGEYPYFCLIHPWETGIITVTNTNSGVESTEPQFYYTNIILDPIPSTVNEGDVIIFSGVLETADGEYVIPDRTIYIKDDVDFGSDNLIAAAITDKNGKFSIKLDAVPRIDEGFWDFYAVFEGEDILEKSRSKTYSVDVVESVAYQTKIILDKILSSVHVGEKITFTGKLTSNNNPVENVIIKIKDDDTFRSDDLLVSVMTNSNGEFSISWVAKQDLLEEELEIYAVFDGNKNYAESRSPNQILNVQKYTSSITLDPIPASVNIGQVVTFSGVLQLDGRSPEGAIVYIKDEDPFGRDDQLTTAIADRNGVFVGAWQVHHVDIDDSPAEIYAVFEGDEIFDKAKTCNSSCTDAASLNILETVVSPKTDESKYLKLIDSYWDHDNIDVLILVNPDTVEESKKYLIAVQEGTLIWEQYLKATFPSGKWNIDVTVEPNPITFLDRKYDVLTTVTAGDEYLCGRHAIGMASLGRHGEWDIIPTTVSVSDPCDSNKLSPQDEVRSTASHEFGHALGLGHAYNIDFDLMCSGTCKDDDLGASPSNLNVKALGYIYGEDGFESPNRGSNELNAMKFYGNEEISIIKSEINVPEQYDPDTQGSDIDSFDLTEETYKKIEIPDWIKVNAKWWAEGKITDSDFVRGIEYLIKEGTIRISETSSGSNSSQEIPIWIKNMAEWWAEGKITDADFIQGIEYLVKEGIVNVN